MHNCHICPANSPYRPPIGETAILLERNDSWRDDLTAKYHDYFPRLAQGQQPKILWIGCSDSRVSEITICGLGCNPGPGDIFTHRNIANIVQPNDSSVQSVIEYAVGTLEVKHIVVCGHSSCGGVEAAWKISRGHSLPGSPFITQWLAPLVQLSKDLGLDLEPDKDKALPILTAENVKQQVIQTRNVLVHGQRPSIHGWVFNLENGGLVIVQVPIPSGYYAIINKANGNINLQIRDDSSEYPVVANPIGHIWKIEHIEDHDYHISAQDTGLVPGSAADKEDHLYVIPALKPEVWVICGEYDATARETVYIIKKKLYTDPPHLKTKAWMLESDRTQVRVIEPPLFQGPAGCEVKRVPAEYIWHIREHQPPT